MDRNSVLVSLKEASIELINKFGKKVVALGLFGSVARDEASDRSDVDVIVIIRDWRPGLERRRQVYEVLHKHVKRDVTLIDVDYETALEIIQSKRSISATMLNIIYDCIIVHDPENILTRLKDTVNKVIKSWGLIRVKSGRAYYWVRKDGKPLVTMVRKDV